MNTHQFYRKFEEVAKEDKFEKLDLQNRPTSLFVIFKQLQQVRAQKKYFEDREKELLKMAEDGFEQLKNKKNTNDKSERT